MTTKTVTIKRLSDQDILHGQRVLNELRSAGVPVLGVLWPTGVEGGRLTIADDEYVCEWDEPQEELY